MLNKRLDNIDRLDDDRILFALSDVLYTAQQFGSETVYRVAIEHPEVYQGLLTILKAQVMNETKTNQ